MKKRLVPIILVLAVLAIAGVLWSSRLNRQDPNSIRISGNLELTQVDISFKVPGKLMERTVDEGDPVKKGQLIARIDQLQNLQQKAVQQAAVQSSEMQLAQAESSLTWQRKTVEADIAMRNADILQAQAQLDQLLAGSRPQEIQQAAAAVADAKTQYQQASADWARAQALYKNDDISTAQRDQYHARYNSTSALLHQAQEHYALVKEGPRKEEIEAARATLARAQAALQVSEANRLQIQQREDALRAQRADVERAKAQLGVSQSQLDDTTVYSPINGVVLVKSAEVGEVLAAGSTVVTVGDIDHPWLRGYIKETDLGRVKLGQKVKLTTDSYPGKVYWGRVSYIADQAEFTPKQIQTEEERVKLVYRIKVDVDNSSHDLKLNMPVDAVIEL
jgi:membrane fusion protein YbhG